METVKNAPDVLEKSDLMEFRWHLSEVQRVRERIGRLQAELAEAQLQGKKVEENYNQFMKMTIQGPVYKLMAEKDQVNLETGVITRVQDSQNGSGAVA